MNIYQKRVSDFLKCYNMDYESVDLEKNCSLFMEEMDLGLSKPNENILLMLPTYIKTDNTIPSGERVIVIDAGGTNLRIALLSFNSSKQPNIEYFESYKMPGSYGEITSDEFYETMYGYLTPILDKSEKIGYCFSYAVDIQPNKDGILLDLGKEIKIPELMGSKLGSGLLNKISAKSGNTYAGKKLIMLNDTAATLLGGKAAFPDRVFDSYLGLILGTGFNLCYIEKVKNIPKIQAVAASEDSMIINIETGHYSKGPLGSLDGDYDSQTLNPGVCRFEKAISGAYQGGLTFTVIKQAARDGLFSAEFAGRLSHVEELFSKDLDDFLYYPYDPEKSILAGLVGETDSNSNDITGIGISGSDTSGIGISGSDTSGIGTAGGGLSAGDMPGFEPSSGSDRLILYYIIDAIFERIAKFVVFELVAILKKTGTGKNPCAPVCVTADGSTFYKSKILRQKLDHYVKVYLNDREGLYIEFVRAENGVITGSAIAALQNAAII